MRAGTQIADWTATDILQGNFAFPSLFGMRSKDTSCASPYSYKSYQKARAQSEKAGIVGTEVF